MTDTLALRYRPRHFDDLVGQPAVQIFLKQMVKVGRIPTALLFAGCRGTGKTTTARIFAAALNCPNDNKPCGTCTSCTTTFNGSNLDLIEIDAASNGLVDDIRKLREQLRYRSPGAYRIVALDEAQSISNAGFNALLKMLEEPPPDTVFLLLTTEPNKILATVASRCMPFTFNRLTINDITRRLAHIAQAEHILVEDDLLQLLAERADGAMRDAIMLLDQVTRVGMTTADQYRRLLGHTDHAPAILDNLIKNNLPAAFTALDDALTRVADHQTLIAGLTNCLRDILVLRCGGEVHKAGAPLAARQNLALAMETPTVLAAMKILWQLRTQCRTDDPRSTLELAIVMLSEIISTTSTPPTAGRITLAEMGNLG